MPDPALHLAHVSKHFGPVRALWDASFDIQPGEVFGYLGPNGAGKTTTLRIVLGLVRHDAGEIRILGSSSWPANSRERVGFLPGDLALYPDMTGRALLDYFAGFRRWRPPVLRERLLDSFEVSGTTLDRRSKFLSHGTRQKLGLIIAMQHDPDLLLLDEPSSGLDPLVQQAFRGIIRGFAERGRAVLFSSHVLSEVEEVCGRVAILRQGQVVTVAAVSDLRNRTLRRLRVRFRGEVPEGLGDTPGVVAMEPHDDAWQLTVRGDVNPLIRRLAQADIEKLVFPEPELEDVFLSFYRESAQEAAHA